MMHHTQFGELIKLCRVVHTEVHEDHQNTIMNEALWRCSLGVGDVWFQLILCNNILRLSSQRCLTTWLPATSNDTN